jgi:hypothetical protein
MAVVDRPVSVTRMKCPTVGLLHDARRSKMIARWRDGHTPAAVRGPTGRAFDIERL